MQQGALQFDCSPHKIRVGQSSNNGSAEQGSTTFLLEKHKARHHMTKLIVLKIC
jgi:hypothetical protein